MTVAQMHRNRDQRILFHVRDGRVDGDIRSVGFGRTGQIGCRLSQIDATFGHADDFGRLKCRGGDGQSHGIRVADIFRCGDDQTTSNESRIFAGFQHPSQPVQSGIRITAANAFNESTGDVVVIVTIRIETNDSPLHGFLRHSDIHKLSCAGNRQHGDLKSSQ